MDTPVQPRTAAEPLSTSPETAGAAGPAPVEAAAPAAPTPDDDHPFGSPPRDLPAYEPPAPTRIVDATGVRLERVDLGRSADRTRFLDVSAPFYAGDPHYIEPLRMERMQFLDTAKNIALKDLEVAAFIAYVGNKPVGRITGHIDRAYDRYHGTTAGWFGFFECTNDRKVAHALLEAATRFVKDKGATEIIGPMNFTTNHQVGLLVSNFDRPATVEMTYNPKYYEELITSFGFGKAKDLLAWWIDVAAGTANPKVARIAKLCERVKKREGVSIRHMSIKNFTSEVETMFNLYNQAWQKNWGFVPVEKEEFVHIAKNLKPIVREELLLVVEVNGKPVGFCVTIPDVNQAMPRNGKLFPFGWAKLLLGLKKVDAARLMVLGMVPEYRKRGLEALMFIETAQRAHALGMSKGEIGWTLEDNWLVNRAIESMDGKLDRTYRLFGLTL